jgi:hypothetical protein
MKKYLIGALFGFLLSLSISVYGEEVKSVIGAVIDGELPVSVNGEKLGNKAITIAGTSYLPVREFAEKVGYNVAFAPTSGISLERKPFDLLDPIKVGKEFLSKKSSELGAFHIDIKTANAYEIKKLNQSRMHSRIQTQLSKNNDYLVKNAIFYNDDQKAEKIEYLQYVLDAMVKNLEQIKTISSSKLEVETYEKYVSSLQNELIKTVQTAPSANEPAIG